MENCPLFVTKDMVVVHNSGGYVRGLDLETGQIRWELENCHKYHTPHPETGMLHGVANINKATYEVIDPLHGQRLVDVPITEKLREHNISAIIDHMHSLTRDALYFSADCPKPETAYFGKVDLKTSTLEYIERIEGDDYNMSKPIYHEGRLYFIEDKRLCRVYEPI
jgi:hypothetical protein